MRKKLSGVALCVLLLTAGSVAQNTKSKDEHKSVMQVLDGSVSNVEREFVSATEAMPEDKFGFAPTNGEFKGVRNFGEQIKHVAAANFVYAAAILGEKPPVDVGEGEDGPAALKTKAETIQY